MKLHSLSLQNFRQHENTRITFANGLTGIIGTNGGGKSTLLEAIGFALYGLSATRGKKESIRFSRAHPKAPVSVELEFELSGQPYRIERGISTAEMYIVGQPIPIADSVTAVNQLVQMKLGMSRDEFFSTFFTGQKELAVMASIGPTERGQFISRILGYERLQKGQEFIRERRRVIAADLNALRASMPDKDQADAAYDAALRTSADAERILILRDAEVAETLSALSALTPRFESSKQTRESRLRLASDLRVAQSEDGARHREFEQIRTQRIEAEKAAEELESLKDSVNAFPALSAERDQQALLARHDARRRALTDSIADATSERARLLDRQKALSIAPEMEKQARELRETAGKEKVALSEAIHEAAIKRSRAVQDVETRINQARYAAAEVQTALVTISEAGDDGQCPTCLRTLAGQAGVVRDALLAQIAAQDAIVAEQRARIGALAAESDGDDRARLVAISKDMEVLDKRLAKIEAGIRELAEIGPMIERQGGRITAMRAELTMLPAGYDAARHKVLTDELERLRPLVDKANKLTVLAGRLEALQEQSFTIGTKAADAEERVAVLLSQLEALPADDFDSVCDECDRARALHAAANLAHERAIGEQKAASEAVKRAEVAVTQATESAAREAELVREHAIHDGLDRAYAELRTDLNKAVRPEIARIASMYLSDLTDGRYSEIDLNEQYELQVIEDGVPKSVISGGEEDVCNLVLRLAISQIIAERSGQSFSLLILDEVFASLDESRRNNVMTLLRSLRDRFDQVLVITHHESVRDACDTVVMVGIDPETGASVLRYPALPDVLAETLELAEVGS